jgi:hypothetical protein
MTKPCNSVQVQSSNRQGLNNSIHNLCVKLLPSFLGFRIFLYYWHISRGQGTCLDLDERPKLQFLTFAALDMGGTGSSPSGGSSLKRLGRILRLRAGLRALFRYTCTSFFSSAADRY